MAQSVPFDGYNVIFKAKEGDEDRIQPLGVFRNDSCVVSCWELTDEELQEVIRTRRVFVAHMTAPNFYPTAVGGAEHIRMLCLDHGGRTFPKQKETA